MKVVYIKLLSLFILSFSILCGTEFNTYNDIKNNIAEIRQEFNEYYDNEKFERALEVLEKYDDNEFIDDTLRLYVKVLKAKTYHIQGEIEQALSNIDTIKQMTTVYEPGLKQFEKILRHPLLIDEMGINNCTVNERRTNNFCICQYLEDRENLESLRKEILMKYFIDVYVVIKDESYSDLNNNNKFDTGEPFIDENMNGEFDEYRSMIDKSEVANNYKTEDKKKTVRYELEPPPDEVFKLYRNKTYDLNLLEERLAYENEQALINRRAKLGNNQEKLAFISLLPNEESNFALKLPYLPIIKLNRPYTLLIDKKYKYSFITNRELKKKPIMGIYWDDNWSLVEYKDDERIIFYFPTSYNKQVDNYNKSFKFMGNYIENFHMKKYIDATWSLEGYTKYSHGPPDSLIKKDYKIDENIDQKVIDIELTDQYEHFDKELRKIKFSRSFLYICIVSSIIIMSSL